MKSDKKILKSASVVVGALLTTSLAAAPSLGGDLLAYNDLGSGAQVRSHLIDVNANQAKAAEATAVKFAELKCGEGKKEVAKEVAKDGKTKATAKKGEVKAEAKSAESKTGEAKCGEDKKSEAKTDAKAESKDSEAKCGEGKCG